MFAPRIENVTYYQKVRVKSIICMQRLKGHDWVHFAQKELLDPIVLRKKADWFSLFSKAFSWETDLWVTLGDFAIKNAKLGREICI